MADWPPEGPRRSRPESALSLGLSRPPKPAPAAPFLLQGCAVLEKILGTYVPDLGGALWLGLLVAFLLYGDFRRVLAPRNLALLGLLAMAPFLNDIGRWGYLAHPTVARYWWTAIFLIVIGHTAWALALTQRPERTGWTPNVPRSGLIMLTGLLVGMNVLMTLGKRADDAGQYTNLGAQRWLETGILPYGDTLLIGPKSPAFGAASTYGPILYLAHLPTVLLLGGRQNPPQAIPEVKAGYKRPNGTGAQVVALLFHLAGLAALFAAARRIAGVEAGLGAVALYASMPYLAGLAADHGAISGVQFISHIAPSALMLMAIAAIEAPFLSGALFALSAGALFYPVFIFPAWFAWRFWRHQQPWRFAAGTVVAGAAILALVVAYTPADGAIGSVGKFVHAIVEHQEGTGANQYGGSDFGFWGTHRGLASFWHAPLVGASPFTSPIFLGFIGLCLGACFMVRRGGVATLAAVTAALAAGVQLWKTHGGGTYIEWYLPFLILALVAGNRAGRPNEAPAVPAPSGG